MGMARMARTEGFGAQIIPCTFPDHKFSLAFRDGEGCRHGLFYCVAL